jgi:hypothetical protein
VNWWRNYVTASWLWRRNNGQRGKKWLTLSQQMGSGLSGDTPLFGKEGGMGKTHPPLLSAWGMTSLYPQPNLINPLFLFSGSRPG